MDLPSDAQPFERLEQLVGLLRRQHRRRLVEDDELRRLQEAADDLDALALADRQVADQRIPDRAAGRSCRRAPSPSRRWC